MKKLVLALLLLTTPVQSQEMSKEQCNELAELYYIIAEIRDSGVSKEDYLLYILPSFEGTNVISLIPGIVDAVYTNSATPKGMIKSVVYKSCIE